MSVAQRIRRLTTMSAAEIAARAAGSLSRGADRVGWQVRRPHWRRRDLGHLLTPACPEAARRAANSDDWAGAHRALQQHFASGRRRFVLDPAACGTLARAITARFPAAPADARARAEGALRGRFDLLGYRDLSFAARSGEPGAIDWHRDPVHNRTPPLAHWSRVPYLDPVIGDHKIIWELNRHHHWLVLGRAYWLTGDRRFRQGFIGQLQDWLAANPPRTGVNWTSMLELALRSISWIWALHLFVAAPRHEDRVPAIGDEPAWTVDLLVGLHHQLAMVERNLSTYFSPNTHLLGEALGLYVAGCALPELRDSARWARVGRTVLLQQIDRQITGDGGHVERSLHYHRYTLDFYLLALVMSRLAGDTDASDRFAGAAGRLAAFAAVAADPSSRLPRIGDDDGGALFPICGRPSDDIADSLAVAAALLDRPELSSGVSTEESIWMTGPADQASGRRPARMSAAFRDTGYIVSRSERGDHLVVDVGPLGFLNGGHAHADALALTLSVRGRPFAIDAGTGCYTVSPDIRDWFRGTSAHNTLTLDGRSQSAPDGPFRWRSAAAVTLHGYQAGSSFDFVDASHDGYRPAVHRRMVLARPGLWLIVDWVLGAEGHDAAVHWHIDPWWTVTSRSTGVVCATSPTGGTVWVLTSLGTSSIVRGRGQIEGLGLCSPAYGQIVPGATVRTQFRCEGPTAVLTAIVDSPTMPMLEPLAESPLAQDAAGDWWRLSSPWWTETILARRPDRPRDNGRLWSVGDVATDGAMLSLREAVDSSMADALVIDGGRVWQDGGRGWWVDSDTPLAEVVHVGGAAAARPARSRTPGRRQAGIVHAES